MCDKNPEKKVSRLLPWGLEQRVMAMDQGRKNQQTKMQKLKKQWKWGMLWIDGGLDPRVPSNLVLWKQGAQPQGGYQPSGLHAQCWRGQQVQLHDCWKAQGGSGTVTFGWKQNGRVFIRLSQRQGRSMPQRREPWVGYTVFYEQVSKEAVKELKVWMHPSQTLKRPKCSQSKPFYHGVLRSIHWTQLSWTAWTASSWHNFLKKNFWGQWRLGLIGIQSEWQKAITVRPLG